ncbi:MAG: response regulator [Phycisphaerae bacterium]
MRTRSMKTPVHERILLVEDEKRLREMLLRALPDMGYEATGVHTAEKALAVMEQTPHGIVVLDLNLPLMSGVELMEILHDRWPETSVIILTGFGDLDAAQKAIRLGVVDFLSKPCGLGDLERAIDRARRRQPTRPPIDTAVEPEPTREAAAPAQSAEGPVHLADIEKSYILAALRRHHGNRNAAAAELGISVRKLYYRLAEYERAGTTLP